MRARKRPKYPVLQAEMDKRGITRKQLADELFYERHTVDGWMRGAHKITQITAAKIRDTFFPDMSMDELFTMDEETKQEIKENHL